MGHSNPVPGKVNSIALSGGGVQTEPQRLGSAPMFARPGEPEPNRVEGERLQEPEARPHREASRTLAEARESACRCRRRWTWTQTRSRPGSECHRKRPQVIR
jgi:hypothetical protein